MIEEEKKAIYNLEHSYNAFEKCCKLDKNIVKTLLNLIQKQDTEINKLNTKNNELLKDKVYLEEENTKALAKYWNAMKCIDKLNNVIDRMAKYIEPQNIGTENVCDKLGNCIEDDLNCNNCIKEYFIKEDK